MFISRGIVIRTPCAELPIFSELMLPLNHVLTPQNTSFLTRRLLFLFLHNITEKYYFKFTSVIYRTILIIIYRAETIPICFGVIVFS